jgi:CHAT domain-containing protein
VKEISIVNELVSLITNNMNLHIQIADKVFEIPTQQLYMKKEQTYLIKNKGLNISDGFDIHDSNSKRSDVIVTILLV